ncbi:MAG: glycosyltransferase [Pseudomonadota bacterium]
MRCAGQTSNPLVSTAGYIFSGISFPIVSAISNQSQDIQQKCDRFIMSDRPHILLLNPQGYAGPTFPFSARDSGGQIDYVNYEARSLADMGYRVTVAARSFKPEVKYASYGDRKGVSFMDGTDGMVRYVFVPGILGSEAPFLCKEEIYRDLETMALNLWTFLNFEAESASLKPWDVSSILFINSHYVDGGMMGQLLVRLWQSQRAAEYLNQHFAPILKNAEFNPVSFLDNLNLNFGKAVLEAYNQTNGNGDSREQANRAEVLRWAAKKLKWSDERIKRVIEGLHKKPGKNKSFSEDSMDATSIGRRLLVEARDIHKGLKKELRRLNRHAWTPHSIGALKEHRAIISGAAQENPHKHMEMNFPVRGFLEGALLRGKNNPLEHLPPPARIVVETSPEIGEAMFWEGRTEKKRALQFLPGIDPSIYYPRQSVDDKDVQAMFEDLVRREVVPRQVVEALLNNPQNFNIIIEASRTDETKRKEWVIEAYAMLPENMRHNTFLFITGERNEETKEIYDPLRQRIDELELGNNVFLVGRVPNEHMGAFSCLPHCKGPRAFQHMQFVIASRMEGWGMAAQNSVAGGLPLIGSKHTPVAGYLRYQDNAAMVVFDDTIMSFSKAMQILIENRENALAMAERGRAIAQQHTWEVLTRRFIEGILDRLKISGAAVHASPL